MEAYEFLLYCGEVLDDCSTIAYAAFSLEEDGGNAVHNYIKLKESAASYKVGELDYSVSMAIVNTYEAVECLESDNIENVYAQLLVDDLLHESGMMWMCAYMTEPKNEYLMGINAFYGCTNFK